MSPEFIRQVTKAVISVFTAWRARSLKAVHPHVFFDTRRVNFREGAVAKNKAMCHALGLLPDDSRKTLGF